MSDQIIAEPTLAMKIVGSHLGLPIGDALGAPYKYLSHKAVMFATQGKRDEQGRQSLGVAGFSEAKQFAIKSLVNLKPGQNTANWLMARSLCRSLIQSRGFDLADIAREHLAEMSLGNIGYDDSTWDNLQILRPLFQADKHLVSAAAVAPRERLQHQGSNNGIAVKIMPLAVWLRDQPEVLYDSIVKLASLTHRDPQASLAAYAVGLAISQLAQKSLGFCRPEELRQQIKVFYNELIAKVFLRERPIAGDIYSILYHQLLAVGKLINNGDIADLEAVCEKIGTGPHCADSIPFALAMLLRHPTDFRAAVSETINCGGDTNNNAALVGALVGMNVGGQLIPSEWIKFSPEFKSAGELAIQLVKVMNIIM